MSNNLNLSQVTAAQNQKEVTINAQSAELDAAITVKTAFAIDNTNARTLTAAEFRGSNLFHITNDSPVPTAAITLTLPAVSRGQFVVVNETSFAVTVTISGQSVTAPEVATGSDAGILLTCDGVNVRQAGGSGVGGGGSTDFNKSVAGNVVASSSTVGFDLTAFFNRGMLHTIKVTETGGVSTGTYDLRLYKKDTKLAADLMYSVDAIDSTADSRVYTDDMVVYYRDDDATNELHVQIDNNDATQSMTFTIEIDAEVFETGVGGGGGDVVGPGSSVDGNVAVFNGATGKLIQDSGVGLLRGNPDAIVNGAMNIWQRGTSFTAIATGLYSADRWRIDYATGGSIDISQTALSDAAIQTATGQRLNFALRQDVNTIDASIAAGDFHVLSQFIEGYRAIPFVHNIFTVTFFARSNVTGTYCLSVRNSGADRTYLKTFTIDVANTWEKKTFIVPAQDASGTWNYTTGPGLLIGISLMAGTTFEGTDGIWQTGNFLNVSGGSNWMATATNNFDLTAIQLDLGSGNTVFRGIAFDEDLIVCQRYYQKSYDLGTFAGATSVVGGKRERASTTIFDTTVELRTSMRGVPTVGIYSTTGAVANIRDLTAAVDRAATAAVGGENSFVVNAATSITDGNSHAFQWTAEAEL